MWLSTTPTRRGNVILALHIRLVLDLSAFVSGYMRILLNKKMKKLSEMGSGFNHTRF